MMEFNNVILNRVFSLSTFQDLINGKSNKIYHTCIKQYLEPNGNLKNNYQIINRLYDYLSKHYRNEYFYKNTLLNKLLIGRHSVNTTTALAELPIHKSKADFVLINGSATVYEIKTELDSFNRL